MPPLSSKRTTWHSLLNPLTRRNRSAPAAEAATLIGQCPAVALYAVVPLRSVENLVLDDLAAYAQGRGWIVPAGCAVADTGNLSQHPESRSGWNRVRALATGSLIQAVVVPSLTHIAYRSADGDREQAWLLRQGLLVITTDPAEWDRSP
ncbi:hypothetical protein OG245_00400 [Streptomyces sp. NBC_01116]|uniref:hypothetical protein n=1 Tax=Streptomyces sp. NBC_01116 TaxID=2903752 RepID=UPI00324D7757